MKYHSGALIFNNFISNYNSYMVMSRDQNAGRNQSVRIDNSTFERVEEFKYLGTTLTIKILFRKKMRAN